MLRTILAPSLSRFPAPLPFLAPETKSGSKQRPASLHFSLNRPMSDVFLALAQIFSRVTGLPHSRLRHETHDPKSMSARIVLVVLLFIGAFSRLSAADTLLITELMAVNTGPLADEDGSFEDWIEIHNPGTNAVNIGGWYISDNAANPMKWQFPSTNVAPNGYLVIFASNKDRRVPGRPLHTNFRLDAGGEYLGLMRPDGITVSSYSPKYSNQVERISFGLPVIQNVTSLLVTGAAAKVYVPSNNALADTWIQSGFDDSSWMAATTGIGFETDNQGPFTPTIIANSVTEFSGKQGSNNWYYGYWDKNADGNGQYSDIDMSFFPNANEAYGPNNFYTGTSWRWFNGNPPFTEITAGGALPTAANGSPGFPNHWAIRRYVSEWSGPLKITGQITHTSDWVYVTATGVSANSLIYVYLTGIGDGYIDDMKLVAGSVPEVGPNLLPNGNFEGALTPPWTVSANHSASAIVTDVKHEGNSSLHLVTSAGGTTQASAIWQTIAPALSAGTYTLSYWFKPGSTPSPLVVRFSSDWIRTAPAYCGDGVTARIFVDGNQVYQQPVFVTTANYSITVPVSIGSRVDFALDSGTNDMCDASGFTAQMETADPANTVVADSIADWSFSGTQGEKNWYYGFYNRTTDAGGVYATNDFTLFPRAGGAWSANNYWDGSQYDWFNGNPPWDQIAQTACHPNGINNGAEHWVIRRWVSEVSGRIVIDWRLAKSNPAGGGVTGRIFHNGNQIDTATIAGTDSVGVNRSITVTGVAVGDFIDIALDPTGVGGDTSDGSDGSVMSATVRGAPSLTQSISTNIRTAMQNVNATAYIRVPFTVADPSSINFLNLKMNYDDGFVAYLNGVQVAARNYSFFPDPLAWNSHATVNRPDSDVNEGENIDITSFAGVLHAGTNILAIQGLNFSAADSDFLILPTINGFNVSLGSTPGYFSTPTPGAANGAASTNIGPLITKADHTPNVPADSEDLTVTATVVPTFFPVSSVRMIYRIMFSNEVNVPMFDDGAHGDGAAGDSVYGAIIPASAAQIGQMIRYYISATDTRTNIGRFPQFDGPVTTGIQKGSPEYLGTIVNVPQTNQLPMLHWFIANPTGANSDTGTRASIFWNGQFRDNVGVTLHGQSSAGFPKRSHNFNLNAGYKLTAREGDPDVSDFAMTSTYADRIHVRNSVNTETYQEAGSPAHYSFPIRVQQNGTFYCVANWLEQGDEEYLKRIGFDENGSLYKMYNTFTGAAGNEKKTRKQDPTGTDDLQQFYNAITQPEPARTTYIYDNVNLPSMVNFLAVKAISSDHDCCHKNYYYYRDSDKSGEWYALPWDFDLSYGHIWNGNNGSYFDDSMQTNNFIGVGNNNTLFAIMWADPIMKAMWLRRIRTLMDGILQPPGVLPENDHLRKKLDYWADLAREDAKIDKVSWTQATWSPPINGGPANPTTTNPTNNFEIELSRIKDFYLPGRRVFLTNPAVNQGIPLSMPTNVFITFGAIDYNPSSTDQGQEYIELINTNNFSVDVSDWKIRGGIEFTIPSGTIMTATNRLYLSPNVKKFRSRTTGPRGGQRALVVAPYKGQLSARGETLVLVDKNGVTNKTVTFVGAPSTAQQYLRVTELMYHPAALLGDAYPREDYEYIELKNIGPVPINLAGVHFTNGVDFVFVPANTTNLDAGATIILAKNPAAFASRYPSVTVPVFAYTGSLDNNGETIQIDDAVGEKVLEFTYNNSWYPLTDGNGFSLVIVDENAPFYTWDTKAAWRASGAVQGSPGAVDPAPGSFPSVIINEVLAHTDPPDFDSIEILNTTTNTVDVGNWWLSDDLFEPRKYRIPAPRLIAPGDYAVFTESEFGAGATGFLLSSTDDEAYIFSGNSVGDLTGYFHGYHFEASANGVSFGRYTNSQTNVFFVAQSSNTFGFPNAAPKVGPVVISEIMYHPPDLGGVDNSIDEFVELHNVTTNAVPLYDVAAPTNRWRLESGIDYVFSTNDVIPANGFLLVVNFYTTNAAQLAAFRTKYGVPTNVPVVGPYAGKLDNSGEDIDLYRPDTPNSNSVPYILVESVSYSGDAPWDIGADGLGPSLQRRFVRDFGNDPTNWFAALPNAGRPASSGLPPVITVQPHDVLAIQFTTTNLSVTVSGSTPLDYRWQRNGIFLAGQTNATLTFSNIQPSDAGGYSVVAFNAAGWTYSATAQVSVLIPVRITSHPTNQSVLPGTNVTMSAQAVGNGTIRYQWRVNGINIPGATNSSYSFTNANLDDHHNNAYSVYVEDAISSAVSSNGIIWVLVKPVFVINPLPVTVLAGGTATLFGVATGAPPIYYRFLRGGAPFLTNSSGVLVLTNVLSGVTIRTFATNIASGLSGVGALPGGGVTITVLPDADRDGMADAWETAYFGNVNTTNNVNNALEDPDGDGMINRDEYVAGTDPTNPLSLLKLYVSATNSGLLQFTAQTNISYTVQSRTSLASSNWLTVTNITATTNISRTIDVPVVNPPPNPERYYRVVTPQILVLPQQP